jgi:lycopene cyclase domain-containing protein
MQHLRYLGVFFVVCVIPAAIFAAEMPPKKILLAFALAFSSWIFLVISDFAMIKSRTIAKRWAYRFNSKAILGWQLFGIPFEEHVFIFTSVLLPISAWELLKRMALGLPISIAIEAFAILLLIVLSPMMHNLDV